MISVVNCTKKPKPKVPWKKITKKILGNEYDLSIVLSDNRRMRKLNKIYRKRDKTSEVLSFPYSKKEGEVFLNAACSDKKMAFLFIHSLLHLRGLKHGKKMEKMEKVYYNNFYGA